MKKFLIIGIFALIFAGCQSTQELSENQKMMEREEQMGELMIEAFRKQDFDGYIQFIPPGGRQQYNKDKFKRELMEITSRMGKVDSFRFLTRLEKEPLHELVWAVRFLSYSLKGEKVYKEALFSIVVGEVDGTRRVFLFGFK